MPVVKIDMWSGRNEEQKGVVIKKITDAIVESCECPKEAITVVITDILGFKASSKFFRVPKAYH